MMHQESITSTQEDSSFTCKSLQEKTTNSSSSFSIAMDLLDSPTSNICKKLLIVVYNLIEAPTSKMCKKLFTIG